MKFMNNNNIIMRALDSLPVIPSSCYLRCLDRDLDLFNKPAKIKEGQAEIKYKDNVPIYDYFGMGRKFKSNILIGENLNKVLSKRVKETIIYLDNHSDFYHFKETLMPTILQTHSIEQCILNYNEQIKISLDESAKSPPSIDVFGRINEKNQKIIEWYSSMLGSIKKFTTKELGEMYKLEPVLVENYQEQNILEKCGNFMDIQINDISKKFLQFSRISRLVPLIHLKDKQKYKEIKKIYESNGIIFDELLRNQLIKRGIDNIACFAGVLMMPDQTNALELIKYNQRI